MKKDIHPNYNQIEVSCVCGNTMLIGTTNMEMAESKIDICSACHPFYTGNQKIVDSEGRVDRFQKRYGKKAS